MNYYIMTLFPEMFPGIMDASILGRGGEKGLIRWETFNIRDYTLDKHSKVDDYPYGGGAGMVMSADPVVRCCRSVFEKIEEKKRGEGKEAGRRRVIYLTPQGRTFSQEMAREFAKEEELVFLCGHYEGIDERAVEMVVTDQVSIGDYVLTGGELPAMVMVDAIARMVPGVLTNQASGETESFYDNLLEYPQYTRPEIWQDRAVPPILLSGDHAKVDAWRLQMAKQRTRERRPDLYALYEQAHPAEEKKKKLRNR